MPNSVNANKKMFAIIASILQPKKLMIAKLALISLAAFAQPSLSSKVADGQALFTIKDGKTGKVIKTYTSKDLHHEEHHVSKHGPSDKHYAHKHYGSKKHHTSKDNGAKHHDAKNHGDIEKHHKKHDKHHGHHCKPARPICKFFVEPESVDFWKAKPIHEAKDLNVTAHPEVAKYGMRKPWYYAESDFNVTHHDKHHGHHGKHHGPHDVSKEVDEVASKLEKEKLEKEYHGNFAKDAADKENSHDKSFPWEKIPHGHQICAFGHKRADGVEEFCEPEMPEEFECNPEPTYFACECISEEDSNLHLTARAEMPLLFSIGVLGFCSLLALCLIIGVVRLPRRMGGDKDRLVSPPCTEQNSEAGDEVKKVITVDGILIHQKVNDANANANTYHVNDIANATASTTAAGSTYVANPAVVTGNPVFETATVQNDEPSAFTPAAPATVYVIPSAANNTANTGNTNTNGLYPEADTVAPINPVVVHVLEGNHNAEPAEDGAAYAVHYPELSQPSNAEPVRVQAAGPSNAALDNAFAAASDHNQIFAGRAPLRKRIGCALVALFPGFAAVVAVIALFPTSGIYYNGC